METRKFKQEDYPILAKWWKDHGWDFVPTLDILSSDGFLCLNAEKTPIAACFMYYASNAPFAFLGLPVTTKEGSDRERIEGLMTSIDAAIKDAKERGVKLITSYTEHPAITKILQRKDFTVLEENSTVLGLANFDVSCLKQDHILKGNK